MKKVLLTGAALMLVGGMVSIDTCAAAEPGVKITGDARVRLWYMNEEYKDNFGNKSGDYDSDTSMDSRIRLNIKGTAAGGSYAVARIRMYETLMGDGDTDGLSIAPSNSNIWTDKAYVGIPFTDAFTLEVGKNRQTYGPLPTTYNFFYDDVHLTGFKGIVKLDNVEINPFVDWMEEAQNDYNSDIDKNQDNDEIRFGAHVKAKLNKDWTVGGMLGYQYDSRGEVAGTPDEFFYIDEFEPNEGFFGSIYVNGKSGPFGIVGELGITEDDLNGFNSWYNDSTVATYSGTKVKENADLIGSGDTGFGGYIFPNYQIDKLNIGLHLGLTDGGFVPDKAYGFVMLGATDNSRITKYAIGTGGDWLWAGLVANYQINESLKLTGNLVYASVDAWAEYGDGPKGAWAGTENIEALDNAWELSAVLQYTISKGADVYFSAGYLKPEFEYAEMTEDDAAFGALTRFELKF